MTLLDIAHHDLPPSRTGVTITIDCPDHRCIGRVSFRPRKFHGVPVIGTCAICHSQFSLSGGVLSYIGTVGHLR